MRYLLLGLGSLVLAGCGSVEITPPPDPDPPPASEQTCVTSLYCPAGELCDAGKCVPDVACPGPSAPRLLFESTDSIAEPYITSLNGRDYLERDPYEFSEMDTETTFLDLATGVTSVLHHAPGIVSCVGDPILCYHHAPSGALTLLTDVTFDAATNVWSAASSQVLPAGYTNSLGTLPDGDLVLYGSGKSELLTFNRSTAQSKPLVALGERWPLGTVLTLPSGPKLVGYTNSGEGSELWSVPVAADAVWTSILKLPQPFKSTGLPVPAGDGWFVVADIIPAGIPHVWHVSPTGTVDVGESDDPLLSAVATRYTVDKAILEGTQGKALVCKGDTCQSGRFDLATLKPTPLGSVTVPGVASLGLQQQRWLSCDAVDAIVQEPIFSADPKVKQAVGFKLYAIRVLPDAKP